MQFFVVLVNNLMRNFRGPATLLDGDHTLVSVEARAYNKCFSALQTLVLRFKRHNIAIFASNLAESKKSG